MHKILIYSILHTVLLSKTYFSVSQSTTIKPKNDFYIDSITGIRICTSMDENVKFKDGQIASYIIKNLPDAIRNYINDRGIHGRINILFIVDSTGRVSYATVMKPFDRYLDHYFVKRIKETEWYPALKNNIPVNAKVILPIILAESREGKGKNKKRRNR